MTCAALYNAQYCCTALLLSHFNTVVTLVTLLYLLFDLTFYYNFYCLWNAVFINTLLITYTFYCRSNVNFPTVGQIKDISPYLLKYNHQQQHTKVALFPSKAELCV